MMLQVPLFVAFEISDVDWSWGCIIDFCAGARPADACIFRCILPNASRRKQPACRPCHLHLQC